MFLFYFKAILAGLTTGIAVSIPLGPAAIEAVSRSLNKGFISGLEVSLGAISADYLYVILLNFGLTKLFSMSPLIEGFFWLISGIVLIIINKFSQETNDKKENTIRNIEKNLDKTNGLACPRGYIDGFFITFINPMTLSAWMAISATVINIWRQISTSFFVIAVISMFLGTLLWFLTLNYLASKGGKHLKKDVANTTSKYVKHFMILLGLFFSLYGIYKLFMRG